MRTSVRPCGTFASDSRRCCASASRPPEAAASTRPVSAGSRSASSCSDREKQQIAVPDEPHRSIRERGRECRANRSQVRVEDVVGVCPLADDAPWRKLGAGGGEELAREERGDAGVKTL